MNSPGDTGDAEKIEKIKEFKEQGNAAYKEGNIRKAIGSYHRAILYIKGLSPNCPSLMASLSAMTGDGATPHQPRKLSPDQEVCVNSLTCDCYNNLAACLLKDPKPNYEKVVEYCDRALDASPGNLKALYRKGTALYSLGDYEGGLKTLQQAPTDASCRKYIELCKEGIKKQDKELATCYKSMFKFS